MDGETAAPPRAIWYGRTPGRDTHSPEVLRGDVERMRALIDSLDTIWRFTAGVLSWHPDDTVTPEQGFRGCRLCRAGGRSAGDSLGSA